MYTYSFQNHLSYKNSEIVTVNYTVQYQLIVNVQYPQNERRGMISMASIRDKKLLYKDHNITIIQYNSDKSYDVENQHTFR